MSQALDLSPPSPWVARWLPAIKTSGSVLDVACGRGRHVRVAAAAGLSVTGIDRDIVGIGSVDGRIELLAADLETDAGWPLGERQFDGVVVTNYLHRPILGDIVSAVSSDGVLIYETFAAGQQAFGRPRRPEFLLQPDELLAAVQGKLVTMAYEHVRLRGPDRLVQRIAALGPAHRWLLDPGLRPNLST